MTTATSSPTRASTPIPWRKGAALVLQVASFVTTLWFIEWIWPEGSPSARIITAILVEGGLVVLKEQLFNKHDPIAGWIGLVIDTAINAGGVLPKMCRIFSFPPIAVLMTAASAPACEPTGLLPFVAALVAGALLSAVPHRLWRG